MKERIVSSSIVAAAVLVGALVVSPSNESHELTKATEAIGREVSSIRSAIDRLAPSSSGWGLDGQAEQISLVYADGKRETLARREKGYYIVVHKDHVVVHMPEAGEPRNGAKRRRLIPFASVRSIEQLRPERSW